MMSHKVEIPLSLPITSSSSSWTRAWASGWQAAAMIIIVITDFVWNGALKSISDGHGASGIRTYAICARAEQAASETSHLIVR